MARPTKYTRKLEKTANEYIDGGYIDENQVVPTQSTLSSLLGISRTTLIQWGRDGIGGFPYILERCNAKQEAILVNKGLTGEFNSNITKLMLGKHGYHDRQETELTVAGQIETITRTIIDPAK